jgi:hypothetical protein
MRRVIAIVVLLVVALGVLAPAIYAAQVTADAHACCRRTGAHHCSSRGSSAVDAPGSASSTAGAGFSGIASKCPMQGGIGSSAIAPAFTLTVPASLHVLLASSPIKAHAHSAGPADSHASAAFGRGPPLA